MNNLLKIKGGIASLKEFDDHRLVSFFCDQKSGLESFVALHRVNPKVPSFGATRLCNYDTSVEGLKDALRLSRLMSYKAALAGLDCGGAKGVIVVNKNTPNSKKGREALFTQYAQKVNLLSGRFITGTDVGISQDDLSVMKPYAPSSIVGFNNNSTESTVLGVLESIKVCLEEIFGSANLQGKKFAIQGLGKVGGGLLKVILKEIGDSGEIYVADVDHNLIKKLKAEYPRIIPVAPEDIHKQLVDVYCPCALGNSLNSKTVSVLRAKIIAGGANNQLENEEIGDMLYRSGILYAPDYVINAGGLIAVFNEYNNKKYNDKNTHEAVMRIQKTLRSILMKSRKQHKSTNRTANEMAERIFDAYK